VLRHQVIRILLGLLIVALFLIYAIGGFRWELLHRLEDFAYDARLAVTMPGGVDRRIVIVDVDEKSLAEEGHWPWPRDRLARLVDRLFDEYHIAVLGMDVVFAERDESSGIKALDRLASDQLKGDKEFQRALTSLRPSLDRDRIFAESLKGRAVVLGYYFDLRDEEKSGGTGHATGMLPPPVLTLDQDPRLARVPFVTAAGYGANLPELQRDALSAGHFIPLVDPDGVVRRIPMLVRYKDGLYESLSLAVARVLLGDGRVAPVFAQGLGAGGSYSGLEALMVGGHRIPVDAHASTLIPYRGRQGSFPYVSAVDVLRGRASRSLLEGTIVLFGTSAPGLMDLRSTPVQSVYPGVEIHANMIAGILDNSLKERPPYVAGAQFAIIALVGLLCTLAFPFLSSVAATFFTGASLLAIVTFNFALWEKGNIALPVASPLLLVLALFLLNMAYGYFAESRAKRMIAKRFGQYVPPELVDEMSRSPKSFGMESESREMTVLFTDVWGFTSISETLDPKELSRLMNDMLTAMTRVIHGHRGTIDKYMGDAVMAFWGAPLEDPDHARHAVEAALDLVREVRRLQPLFHERGWPEFRVGIGINTGLMRVGNMGSEFRVAYTVLGDAVNLGSRIEALTRTYGADVMVSESTRESLPGFVFREVDRVRVKGRDQPTRVFEPMGPEGGVGDAKRAELALWESGLKQYREQDWDRADATFAELHALQPEYLLYRTYLQRVAYFRTQPPAPDWDGTFVWTAKK
jgi:adenylate cyclase